MTEPLKVIAGAADRPLIIGSVEIDCYVLEDETRVLSQRGLQAGIGMSLSGARTAGVRRIGEFLASLENKGLNVSDLTARASSPIEFQPPIGGRTALAYPAEMLVDLCKMILEARDAGLLLARQMHIAHRADILIRGLATLGIVALVDEATGYQRIRAEQALATILEAFIAKELQPWTKTFPYEFYEQLYRLRGWVGPDGNKRTQQVGKDTNDLIYSRVAPGVLDELQELNPMQTNGSRRWRHHQWFTPEPGYIKLNQHIAAVMALMRAAPNWTRFKSNLQRAFPKLRDQLELDV